MKHNIKITILLLAMFLFTQLIGLAVIYAYNAPGEKTPLPYGMEPQQEISIVQILISFTIAITLMLILAKYRWKFLMKLWFFVVIVIALAITFNAIFKTSFESMGYNSLIALIISIPLAYFKIYRPNILLHNLTELLIYPGIAAVFVPVLSVWSIILLLIIISIYDAWAVWQSGIMQKMAKFQMDELKIFGGFLIPYASKKMKEKIQKLKEKYKLMKGKTIKLKDKDKIKLQVAILGGGDVIFPIITAGVFLKAYGILPALCITLGALLGLLFLLTISKKKKFYPAMPFITAGMFLGMLLGRLLI